MSLSKSLAAAAVVALATGLATSAAWAQAGGSDRMPGGVEARPSEPEGFRARGLSPAPAPRMETAKPPADKPATKPKKAAPPAFETAPPVGRGPQSPRGGGTDEIPGGVEHKSGGKTGTD